MSEPSLERRLAELARLTEPIRPRPDFNARVLAAVARDRRGVWTAELARSARSFLPLALALTVVSVAWAARAEGSTDAEIAAAEQPMELEW
jgi:hypothetical protein